MYIRADKKYLQEHQYKDATNLKDRKQLHDRFSTNKYDFFRWIFDQLVLSEKNRILDLGCGPAWLWQRNLDRVPEGWDLTLSDISPGMLQEAQTNLQDSQSKFEFKIIDAEAIPFPDESFDTVIANHMLYHVPDREKGLSEIQRVLRSGGCLYAATNSHDSMKELVDLVRRVDPDAYPVAFHKGFTLENGKEQLSASFGEIKLYNYEDSLIVPEAEPLVTYVKSSERLNGSQLAQFRKVLEDEIASRGPIHMAKSAGMFEARKVI